MFRVRFWFGVLSVLLVTSLAFAQEKGQGGRRPGGFGGGGGGGGGFPGGGFGGFGGGGGNSPLQLINAEPVQKELGLKEEQIAKAKSLGDDMRKEMEASRGDFNREEFQKLSDDERTKRMEEMRTKGAETARKMNEKFRPKLAEILDAQQTERLQQIAWQAAGTQALQDPQLTKALDISDEQKSKLTAISKEFADKQQEMFRGGFGGGGGGDFQERMTKMREMNDSRDKAMVGVISKDQQEKFTALKGKEFDVAQLRRGFGGPGGPGGGGDRPNAAGRPNRRPPADDKKAEDKK